MVTSHVKVCSTSLVNKETDITWNYYLLPVRMETLKTRLIQELVRTQRISPSAQRGEPLGMLINTKFEAREPILKKYLDKCSRDMSKEQSCLLKNSEKLVNTYKPINRKLVKNKNKTVACPHKVLLCSMKYSTLSENWTYSFYVKRKRKSGCMYSWSHLYKIMLIWTQIQTGKPHYL